MKKKGHGSGWYTSEGGNVFHAHGSNMSDETIKALGAVADAVRKMIEMECPNCGAKYTKGLNAKDGFWFCQCGWTDKES
jgi:hypothetical protein